MIRSTFLSLLTIFSLLSSPAYGIGRTSFPAEQAGTTLRRADSLLARGKAGGAKALYAALLSQQADDIRALNGLGRVALAERDWPEALAMAKRAMKLDTADIPARYIAAVACREIGSDLFFRESDRRSSREQFEWILKRDSSFEDALYQYALLERYDGNQEHAFALARREVARKPELLSAQLGLYRLYRFYMAARDSAQFLGWLRTQSGTMPRYFIGETLRRHGNSAGADSVLTRLLDEPGEVPPQAIGLSLARLRHAQGRYLDAENEYWKAVRDLRTQLGAALLFEDLKYVVSDGELDLYNSLDSVSRKRDFFRSFWNFRNPSVALDRNPRLQEHMRRHLFVEAQYEYYGFRTRFNDPDEFHVLTYPRASTLNEEINDMGLIYMRQGEPDDVVRGIYTEFDRDELYNPSASLRRKPLRSLPTKEGRDLVKEDADRLYAGMRIQSTMQDPSESWLYKATPESPRMIFHFQKHNASGNNWRLSPLPSYEGTIEELQLWDPQYHRLYVEPEINRAVAQEEIKTESRAAVSYGLSTEKQTWDKKTETFRFPHALDIFRAPEGQSLLDVSYAIPLASLLRGVPDSVKSIPVEIGFSLVDANSRHILSQRDTMRVGLSRARTGMVFDLIRYTVPPDSYAVSMHVRSLVTDVIGTWQQPLRVTDFSPSGFMMSSVQFLRPSTDPGSLAIDGVKVVQSPLRAHARTEPLYVYFQVYHLIPDGSGNTAYRVECVLLPRSEQDVSKGTIVYRKEKTGRDEASAEFCRIDVHAVDPGHYTLFVNVTDRKRVQTLTAARELDVLGP